MEFCLAENGQPSEATGWKFKCKCAKLFASITAFDTHEKIAAHRDMFASRDWATDYAAAGIRIQEAEVAPGAAGAAVDDASDSQ